MHFQSNQGQKLLEQTIAEKKFDASHIPNTVTKKKKNSYEKINLQNSTDESGI